MCVSQSRFLYQGVKHFEVSVSQSKKSKCLGFAKKNAGLAVSHLPFATPINITLSEDLAKDNRKAGKFRKLPIL